MSDKHPDNENDDETDLEGAPETGQEDAGRSTEPSQQEHHNPETQEDTASGGAA